MPTMTLRKLAMATAMWTAPVADSDDRSALLSMRSVGKMAERIAPAP
jgi:hypothetical protein